MKTLRLLAGCGHCEGSLMLIVLLDERQCRRSWVSAEFTPPNVSLTTQRPVGFHGNFKAKTETSSSLSLLSHLESEITEHMKARQVEDQVKLWFPFPKIHSPSLPPCWCRRRRRSSARFS